MNQPETRENMIVETPSSVLIVDDNSKNLQVLADILRAKNYRVATSKDGFKALNFVSKRKPDIILLDIMMPDMDGYEVCRRLKDDANTRDIPVIFISALTDTADKVKGFQAGGVDYITKPFQKEEVFARVDAHLKLKRAQEDLKKANYELKTANTTKDKLFSIIAHDLRSPIGSLSGILEVITDDPELLDPDQQAEYLRQLRDSVKNVGLLLENLLYWAGSQRGTIEYQPQFINLAQVVDVNIRLLSNIASEKSIGLISDIPVDAAVYADENMVMTIIRNLISNALKFTTESGEIRISAQKTDNMTTLCIADTGIGITEENLKKLFRQDEHFTTYGTKKEKGSGLGLLLCKEFVERNQGEIWVESEEGQGSRFFFTLPNITELVPTLERGNEFDTPERGNEFDIIINNEGKIE